MSCFYFETLSNLSSRMVIATPSQLQAANVKATDKPSLVIEKFDADWHKEWFTYDLTDNWARRTHKLYDPKWQAPASAKLALDVRSEQANRLVIGLDNHAAEIKLNGGKEWQQVVLAPSDFRNASGEVLLSWKGIKELRLLAKDTLRGKGGNKDNKLELGSDWQGSKPEFRNLRWAQ